MSAVAAVAVAGSRASVDAAETAVGSLVDASRTAGVLNTRRLAERVLEGDPELRGAVTESLSPLEARRFEEDYAAAVDARRGELALDLTQIALDVAGLVDPTPISDGANGIISLFRGDFFGAGISAVAMVPYLGDAAKLGKLGKWAETVANAAALARADAAFAAAVRPTLRKIAEALEAVPLDPLPKGAQDALQSLKAELGGALAAPPQGTARQAANFAEETAGVTRTSAKIGDNSITWTLDAEGRPARAQGSLRDVFAKLERSSDETAAQREVVAREGTAGDHGGHVVGHRFVADQGLKNLFAQNGAFNTGAYKKLENEWADAVSKGREVQLDVGLRRDDAGRVDRVTVKYKIVDPDSGDIIREKRVTFKNDADQTFDRAAKKDL